jgi:flagellar assembly protein FliH
MTLQSEDAIQKADSDVSVRDQPARLIEPGVRAVSRLLFHSLEPVEEGPEQEIEGAASQEEDSVARAMDDRLRLQEEQHAVAIENARREGREEARLELEDEIEQMIAEKRAVFLKASEAFRQERARYFAGVEAEVVKLALAIAARVLHREVAIDPLLLAGVVRVALEKIDDASSVVLRVPTDEWDAWTKSSGLDISSSLQLKVDDRLAAGEYVLDTKVGRVELGIAAQLAEIERGFFDLMRQRPA